MGECLLVRRGGGKPTLKGISVKTPPTKIQYLEGEAFDFSGMVISANLSGTLVDIMSGYTCTPTVMGANDTTVTISYTVNGKTATTTQVMQKNPYYPVLANNTWDTIADACAKGLASSLWQLGDEKSLSMNGNNYNCKIVAFDFHALSANDENYGNAGYNAGKNKSGITFLVTPLYSQKKEMAPSRAGTNITWSTATMRTQVMQDLKALMPTDLQALLRTVSVKSSSNGERGSAAVTTSDQLFLPSLTEIKGLDFTGFKGEGTQLPYFEAGNSPKIPTSSGSKPNYWTRSRDDTVDEGVYSVCFRLHASNGHSTSWAYNNEYFTFEFCL